MVTTTARTQGIHHVGLTVPDIVATQTFFREALGFSQVREVPDYPAVFVSDGTVMLTLWQAEDPTSAIAFDRRRVIGLHHLALRVAAAQSLDALYEELAERDDVTIEFAPEPLRDGPTRHMICAIPGGIRIELIAPA
ncbi:VOC family protein [Salinisphaera aquimarina]|uniref:VOC family protein n=1 Tax=Salinisphaera aquimarina TaxID=2094031 RepID=A0ABV7ETU0_9GAMM